MAEIIQGNRDQIVDAIKAALDAYEEQHPGSVARLYRQNSASVRVRVVDEGFAGKSKGARHDLVWQFLSDRLNDEALQEVSVLLLLTPSEEQSSFMNFEFNHPSPSGL